LVIPTLEDLKYTTFGSSAQEVGYPLKITKKEDIESVAFLAQCAPRTLGHYDMIPILVSKITEMVQAIFIVLLRKPSLLVGQLG
jgi:hypothetical protein